MTEAVKRDLQLIKMRGYLDPKRFYKVRAGCAAVTQRASSSSHCHLYVLPLAGCRQQGSTQSVPGTVGLACCSKSACWVRIALNSPSLSQVGTVQEGAGEYHSARLTKRQRRATIADTLMSDRSFRCACHCTALHCTGWRWQQLTPMAVHPALRKQEVCQEELR